MFFARRSYHVATTTLQHMALTETGRNEGSPFFARMQRHWASNDDVNVKPAAPTQMDAYLETRAKTEALKYEILLDAKKKILPDA